MKQMKTGILAGIAMSFFMCALGVAAAGRRNEVKNP